MLLTKLTFLASSIPVLYSYEFTQHTTVSLLFFLSFVSFLFCSFRSIDLSYLKPILFLLRKTSVSVETYQISLHVLFWFICAFYPESSSFFFPVRSSSFNSYFCVIRTSVISLSLWFLSCFYKFFFLLHTYIFLFFTVHGFMLSQINFLMIEKDLCECRNVTVKFPCALLVYLCPSLHFSGKNFPFFIPIVMLSVLRYFPFTRSYLS